MASPHSVNIAIVDDEASVRSALLRLFRASGYSARAFASGPEFLGTLSSCHFDCLILDLQMQKMSGLEVQMDDGFLKACIPTVIITAHDEPGTRQKCLEAGAEGFLCKPFDDNELLAVVMHAMKR